MVGCGLWVGGVGDLTGGGVDYGDGGELGCEEAVYGGEITEDVGECVEDCFVSVIGCGWRNWGREEGGVVGNLQCPTRMVYSFPPLFMSR